MDFKKHYEKLIMEVPSIKLFYALFLSISAFILLDINNFILMVLSSIALAIFVKRVIIRVIGVKKLHYFDTENEDFSEDNIKRGELLRDIFSIIMFSFITLALYDENMSNRFADSFVGSLLFFTIFYFLIAGLSITKNSKVLKVISILFSTVQGLTFVLFSIVTLAITIFSLIGGEACDFFEALNSELVVNICYLVQSSLSGFIVIALISLSLLLTLIILTPPSQLSDLAISFKIINIIMVLLSVSIFFAVNMNWESIKAFVASELQNPLIDSTFRSYLTSFTKKNILNTGYLLILPYSLGILISNFVIDNLKNMYTKKSKVLLVKILKKKDNPDLQNKVSKLKLKYAYYGGDKFLLEFFDLGSKK